MDGAGAIIAVVFVALALIGGGIVAAYSSQTTATEYDATESVTTGGIGNITELDNSTNAYYWSDDVDIETSNNKLLVAGEDYDWHSDNGTFTVLSSDAANTDLTVSYSYGAQSESQETATNTIGMLLEAGAYIPFLLILALVFIALAVFGGLS